MKKKIGDLTIRELKKMCKKCNPNDDKCQVRDILYICCPDCYIKANLNKMIEVEEDE